MLFEIRKDFTNGYDAVTRRLESRQTFEDVGHRRIGTMVFSVVGEDGKENTYSYLLEDALLYAIDNNLEIIKVYEHIKYSDDMQENQELSCVDTLDVNTVIRQCARFLFSTPITYSIIPGEGDDDIINIKRYAEKNEILNCDNEVEYDTLMFSAVNSQGEEFGLLCSLAEALDSAIENGAEAIKVLALTQDHVENQDLEPYCIETIDVNTILKQHTSIRAPLEYSLLSSGGLDVIY